MTTRMAMCSPSLERSHRRWRTAESPTLVVSADAGVNSAVHCVPHRGEFLPLVEQPCDGGTADGCTGLAHAPRAVQGERRSDRKKFVKLQINGSRQVCHIVALPFPGPLRYLFPSPLARRVGVVTADARASAEPNNRTCCLARVTAV